MSPQRQQMIEAMILAGLSEGTQAAYLRAVWQLAKYYRRAPDQLSGEEVRAYLLDLRRRGVARGTFEIARAHPPTSPTVRALVIILITPYLVIG